MRIVIFFFHFYRNIAAVFRLFIFSILHEKFKFKCFW